MKRTLRSTLAGLGITVVLASGLALTAPGAAQAARTPGAQAVVTHLEAQRGGERTGRRGAPLVAALVRATAEATGLSTQDVVTALRSGQSLAQIAAANGSSAEAVVQAVTAKARERLDRQVAAGRLSQERADEQLARLTTQATDLVNDTTLGTKIDERIDTVRTRAVTPGLVRAASDITGLPVGDIAGRLRDGESLEQIVRSAGADPTAVIDAATAAFRAAAEQAMSATR